MNAYISSEEAFNALRLSVESYLRTSSIYYEELCKRLVVKDIPKGEIFVSEGQACNFFYFLADGFCFRYYVREGKEFITDFFEVGEFAFITHSFFAHQNSLFNMRTSENSTFLVLGYADCMKLCEDFPDFKELIFQIVLQQFIRKECIEPIFRCYTAKERILHFYKSHQIQNWIQHIPQYRIASRLNMTPEVFAKIWGGLRE